ncbi:MAG: alpha-amylase family glycosyl hydrolase [Salibacteraceae bacterium]
MRIPPLLLACGLLVMFSCQSTTSENPDVANEPTDADTTEAPVKAGVQHLDWSKNANIYEVNIRQYTPEGTITAFRKHLPRLQQMGVKILWLMPIYPIGEKNRKGELGSYYSIKDYTSVNPEFGTEEDFHGLVKEVHERGMYLILDWVANHSAWDHPWVEEHPNWYQRDSAGNLQSPYDWTDVVAFDYDNTEMRQGMKEALSYWIQKHDVDGYRCDVAFMVPTEFWNDVRIILDAIKPVFMLAEAEHPENQLQESAFDMSYAWDWHHLMNHIAKGEQNLTHIDTHCTKYDSLFPADAYRMSFITNHDENSWNGTVWERLDAGAPTYAVLSHTLRGMPLIYSGQEAGLDRRLSFFGKDEIDWKQLPFESFFTALNGLKSKNSALWNGTQGASAQIQSPLTADSKVLVYSRMQGANEVWVALNLSGQPATFPDLKAQPQGDFTELFSGKSMEGNAFQKAELAAWEYRVMHREG